MPILESSRVCFVGKPTGSHSFNSGRSHKKKILRFGLACVAPAPPPKPQALIHCPHAGCLGSCLHCCPSCLQPGRGGCIFISKRIMVKGQTPEVACVLMLLKALLQSSAGFVSGCPLATEFSAAGLSVCFCANKYSLVSASSLQIEYRPAQVRAQSMEVSRCDSIYHRFSCSSTAAAGCKQNAAVTNT